jgi:hypothetical protein
VELPNGNVACLVCNLHHHIAGPLTARGKPSKWLTQNKGLTKANARKDRARDTLKSAFGVEGARGRRGNFSEGGGPRREVEPGTRGRRGIFLEGGGARDGG